MRLENSSVTPTLAECIQTGIDANLIDLHVCLPAKIVEYDSSTQSASVQVTLLKTYENGLTLPWPVIPNVPVIFPRANAGLAYMHFPLVADDDVTLVICERSLDVWKETGEMTSPDDRRQFNITDAYAIPGGSAPPLAFEVEDPQAIEFQNGESKFQLKPDGTIVVKNAGSTVTVDAEGTATIDCDQVNIGTGASHGVGLGDHIEDRLSALENKMTSYISDYNSHLHNTTAPGAPTLPPLVPEGPFTPGTGAAASTSVQVST